MPCVVVDVVVVVVVGVDVVVAAVAVVVGVVGILSLPKYIIHSLTAVQIIIIISIRTKCKNTETCIPTKEKNNSNIANYNCKKKELGSKKLVAEYC